MLVTADCRRPVTSIESKVQAVVTQEIPLFWGRKFIFMTQTTKPLLTFLSSKWIGALSFASVKLSDVSGVCDLITSSVICLKNTETVVCVHLAEQTCVEARGAQRTRAPFPAPAVRFQQWGSSVCGEMPGQLTESKPQGTSSSLAAAVWVL